MKQFIISYFSKTQGIVLNSIIEDTSRDNAIDQIKGPDVIILSIFQSSK
jgi:hypothetical protein